MHDPNPSDILDRVAEAYPTYSAQLRQAAQHILDHSTEIGVSSMRQVAAAAGVKPNTLVRLARALGFDGYEAFREPFRQGLIRGVDSFPDRARWLQNIAQGGRHGQLYGQMAATSMSNLEGLYQGIAADEVKRAADSILRARTAYLLGMGACFPVVHGLFYIGRMAIGNMVLVPQQASVPQDDIAHIGEEDVLFAVTYHPYRRATVEAVRLAQECGATVIALTDSRTSPIARGADQLFVVPMGTPLFFPSVLPMHALVESLLACMVAETDEDAVRRIERFHRRREESAVYWTDEVGSG